MLDAPQQPRFVFQIGGLLANLQGALPMSSRLGRREAFGRPEQLLAGLRHQRERSRDGDVGQNVRGVFQTQTIFDQTGLSRLPNDFVKNLLKAFGAKPRAELGSETWFGQGRLDRQIEKEAERDIDLRLTNDALVGQPVVKLQQEQFEQADGINRAAPHIRRVTWGNKRAYGVEIHGGLETPQIMIRRHELLEDQVVKRCQDDVIVIFEHHVLSRSIRGAVTVHRLPGDGNFLSDLWKGAGPGLALATRPSPASLPGRKIGYVQLRRLRPGFGAG